MWIDVPEEFLDERRRLGHDKRDELVVEVLSPNDESRNKFDLYACVGVREVLLVEPKTRETELYALRADGSGYDPIPFVDRCATSAVLGITLEIADGPLLRLRDGAEIHEI